MHDNIIINSAVQWWISTLLYCIDIDEANQKISESLVYNLTSNPNEKTEIDPELLYRIYCRWCEEHSLPLADPLTWEACVESMGLRFTSLESVVVPKRDKALTKYAKFMQEHDVDNSVVQWWISTLMYCISVDKIDQKINEVLVHSLTSNPNKKTEIDSELLYQIYRSWCKGHSLQITDPMTWGCLIESMGLHFTDSDSIIVPKREKAYERYTLFLREHTKDTGNGSLESVDYTRQ